MQGCHPAASLLRVQGFGVAFLRDMRIFTNPDIFLAISSTDQLGGILQLPATVVCGKRPYSTVIYNILKALPLAWTAVK